MPALDAPFLMTTAESLSFTLEIVDSDVTLSDYDWFYNLTGPQDLALIEGDGITVDDGDSTITIAADADYRLAAGSYKHGLLQVNKTTSKAIQIFTGEGSVTESPNA